MISWQNSALYVYPYCCLCSFFALAADKQSALVPSQCEPTYASFGDGDGTYTRPLQISLGNFQDAAVHIAIHWGEDEYSFVSEELNNALCEAIRVIRLKWSHDEEFFDTDMLDAPKWNHLREAARNVWDALDENHRAPFENWRDFLG